LQKKTPFNIPLTQDITNRNVNTDIVKKKKQVVVFTRAKGVYNGVKVFNIKLQDIVKNGLKHFPERWLEVTKPLIVVSDNVELQKYPSKRKFSVKTFGGGYQIDHKLAKSIVDNGEVIWDYKKE